LPVFANESIHATEAASNVFDKELDALVGIEVHDFEGNELRVLVMVFLKLNDALGELRRIDLGK
jgi:hypothetical protein